MSRLLSQRDIKPFLRIQPQLSTFERGRLIIRKEQEDRGIVGLFKAAIGTEFLVPEAMRMVERRGFEYDPDYNFDLLEEEQQEKLTFGIPEDQWTELNSAVSLRHAQIIAGQLRQINENNRILQEAGFLGLFARIGAAVIDPIALGIGFATGGLGFLGKGAQITKLSLKLAAPSTILSTRGALAGARGARLVIAHKRLRRQQLMLGTFLSGIEEGAIETVLSQTDPTRGPTDILLAAAGGGVLGGLGTIAGSALAFRKLRKTIELFEANEVIKEVGPNAKLSKSGEAYFKPSELTDRQKRIDEIVDPIINDLNEDDVAFIKAARAQGDLEAIEKRLGEPPNEGTPPTGQQTESEIPQPTVDTEPIISILPVGRREAVTEAENLEKLITQNTARLEKARNDLEIIRREGSAPAKADAATSKIKIADASLDLLIRQLKKLNSDFELGIDQQLITKSNIRAKPERETDIGALPEDRVSAVEEVLELQQRVESLTENLRSGARTIRTARAEGGFDDSDIQAAVSIVKTADRSLDFVIVRLKALNEKFNLNLNKEDLTKSDIRAQLKIASAEGITAGPIADAIAKLRQEISRASAAGELPSGRVLEKGDFWFNINSAKSKLSRMRITIAGRLGGSASDKLRIWLNGSAQDAMNKVGNVAQAETASEYASRGWNAHMGDYWFVAQDEFNKYAKEKGLNFANFKIKEWDKFLEEVGKAIRQESGKYTRNAHINKVADYQRNMFKGLLEWAQRHNARGFEAVTSSTTFLPRMWSVNKIQALEEVPGGLERVQNRVADALQAENDISDELAQRWAKGLLRIVRDSDKYTDLERAHMASGNDPALLRQALEDLKREKVPELTDDDIESIIRSSTPRPAKGQVLTARGRRRSLLDETMIDGSSEDGMDLLVSNAGELMDLYVRQVLGAGVMSEVLRGMSEVFQRPLRTIKQLETALEVDLREAMERQGRSAKQIGRQVAADITDERSKFNLVVKSIMGRRLGRDNAWGDFTRMARLTQHLRVFGQGGFAQLPELGLIVGNAGFRVMIQQMPALRHIIRQVKSGEVKDPLVRDLISIWGFGVSGKNDSVLQRIDTNEGFRDFTGGKFERGLRRAVKGSNYLNFMIPIHAFEQQLAGLAAIQRWANISRSGRIPNKRRLAAMAVSKKDAIAIMEEIKAKSKFDDDGLIKSRLIDLNINQWNNTDAANKFIGSVNRWSRRTVQEIDIGNMATWMTRDGARLVTQFRVFSFVAWEKQFLHRVVDLTPLDWQIYMQFASTMLPAALGYIAQQHLLTRNRSDGQEIRDKNLTFKNISLVAFQRAGWTSFFPDVFDNLDRMGGGEGSLFNGRNSQLRTAILSQEGALSNPSADMITSLFESIRGISKAARRDDIDYTRKDFMRASTLLPLNRVFGVQNMINAFGNMFQEEQQP